MHDPRPDPAAPLAIDPSLATGDIGIDAGFRRCAAQTPDAVAVAQGDTVWTYRALDAAAARLAVGIDATAAGDLAAPVLIHARRGAALVVAVLAAVRAGRSFAIVDAAYPAAASTLKAEILAPGLIICAGTQASEAQALFGPSVPVVEAPGQPAADAHEAVAAPPLRAPHPVAYLLFTSGTTGRPKCIATGHAPLRHFIDFYRRRFAPSAADRFSMLSGLGHDPLLRDLFVPLSCGARLCIPDESLIRSAPDLYAWLHAAQVSFVHATPQLLRLIGAGRGTGPALTALTHVLSGGDMLMPQHVDALRAAAPEATLVNLYGATETPQAVGHHVVEPGATQAPIPLGRGIDDVQLLVLTDDLHHAPVGVGGQIAVRTRYRADGYRDDPEATRRAFVASPFTDDPTDQLYLTGDHGHYRDDGAVVCTGRRDDQVKIRGHRVELAEVARALADTGWVADAAPLAHRTALGENQLVAFVVVRPEHSATDPRALRDGVRQALLARLPEHMVPARLEFVDALPLSPNGKVDRAALTALAASRRTRRT